MYNKILPVDPLVIDDSNEDIDQKLHNVLVNGDIIDDLNLVKELKCKKKIVQPIYTSKEIPKEIFNLRYKYQKNLINNIFESINRLEETLNRFDNLSKK